MKDQLMYFKKLSVKKIKKGCRAVQITLCMLVLDNSKCDLLKVLPYLFYRIIKSSAGNQV